MASQSSKQSLSLILLIFVSSRLMLLMALPPENLVPYSDYHYYFNSAEMSQRGLLPFLTYWSEYPPIFPYLNLGLYALAGEAFHNHILLLAFVLIVADAGNLYLLYRIAFTLYGRDRAIHLAWIYTALFVPFLLSLINFDALTTFFILLGLYALIKTQRKTLAVALALGTMLKLLPAMLIAAIWRRDGLKPALIYGAITLAVSVAMFAPFYLASPEMTQASLLSQASKSSYQTVWALLDGNYTTGGFGPLERRLDPAEATTPLHNPAVIPSWLTLLLFGGFGLFILMRPRQQRDENRDAVMFTAITLVIFFLWSPGWSPQWQMMLIPLLLLVFPEREAVLYVIVLAFINFLEWPVMLSRGMNELLPVTVLARTAIFTLIGVRLYTMLTQPSPRRAQAKPINREPLSQ